jgi:hypothetical protein
MQIIIWLKLTFDENFFGNQLIFIKIFIDKKLHFIDDFFVVFFKIFFVL